MNDTSRSVSRLIRARYAELDGCKRLVMGAEMFEMARTLASASFPEDLSDQQRRRLLCERLYGQLADRVFPKT